MRKNWFTWSWLDPSDGRLRYVGAGPERRGIHPATQLWEARFHGDSQSPLTAWLKSLPSEPKRGIVGDSGPLTRVAAEELATANRDRLKAAGVALLSTRAMDTFVTGGGLPKVCIDPAGDLFVSVSAAARDHGVDVGTITRRIAKGTNGWRWA